MQGVVREWSESQDPQGCCGAPHPDPSFNQPSEILEIVAVSIRNPNARMASSTCSIDNKSTPSSL